MEAVNFSEYRDLVAKAERIETLKRLFKTNEYVSMADVKAVLGITEDGEENEQV